MDKYIKDYKVIYKKDEGKEYIAYFDKELEAVESVQRNAKTAKYISLYFHDGTEILYIEEGVVGSSAIGVREGQNIIKNPIVLPK